MTTEKNFVPKILVGYAVGLAMGLGAGLVALLPSTPVVFNASIQAPAAPLVVEYEEVGITVPSPSVSWANDKDPNTSTMPVYGFGSFYAEAGYGVKLRVLQHDSPTGEHAWEIFALADEKEIYGK